MTNRTAFHHIKGEPERLKLEHVGKTHAVLERGDGATLNVPAAWLPKEARAGDLLLCSLEPGENSSSLTFELGVPDEVEEAIALEG